jgi:hypothetical protein
MKLSAARQVCAQRLFLDYKFANCFFIILPPSDLLDFNGNLSFSYYLWLDGAGP